MEWDPTCKKGSQLHLKRTKKLVTSILETAFEPLAKKWQFLGGGPQVKSTFDPQVLMLNPLDSSSLIVGPAASAEVLHAEDRNQCNHKYGYAIML